MIKGLNKGLLITDFIGSSINGATGDYSRGCFAASGSRMARFNIR